MCLWCKRLQFCIRNRLSRQNSRRYFSPSKKKILLDLKRVKYVVKKNISRSLLKINRLQDNLNQLEDDMNKITETNVLKIKEDSNIHCTMSDGNFVF